MPSNKIGQKGGPFYFEAVPLNYDRPTDGHEASKGRYILEKKVIHLSRKGIILSRLQFKNSSNRNIQQKNGDNIYSRKKSQDQGRKLSFAYT